MNRPADPPLSLIDRLLSLGVENTARALPLVEEIRKRLSLGEADLGTLWEGAEGSPDPLAFFLGLSKLADAVPPADLAGILSHPEKLPAAIPRRRRIESRSDG